MASNNNSNARQINAATAYYRTSVKKEAGDDNDKDSSPNGAIEDADAADADAVAVDEPQRPHHYSIQGGRKLEQATAYFRTSAKPSGAPSAQGVVDEQPPRRYHVAQQKFERLGKPPHERETEKWDKLVQRAQSPKRATTTTATRATSPKR